MDVNSFSDIVLGKEKSDGNAYLHKNVKEGVLDIEGGKRSIRKGFKPAFDSFEKIVIHN